MNTHALQIDSLFLTSTKHKIKAMSQIIKKNGRGGDIDAYKYKASVYCEVENICVQYNKKKEWLKHNVSL